MKTQINPRKRHHRLGARLRAGFSLVELLIVIAVIGVIAAIAIPSISGITDSANTAKAQRNAQNIVSTYNAALAAGATAATDGTAAVTAVTGTNVITISGVAFDGKTFSVPNLTGTELTNALNYIDTTVNPPAYKP
jgi:type IV pilus assembly protein PilA